MIAYRERNYTRLVALLPLVVLLGCGGAKITTFFKQPDEVAKYEIVKIHDFGKTEETWVPYDSYFQIPDMVAESLRKTNHFVQVSRSTSSSVSDGRVLLVEGTVIGFSRGCKFCEWFFFGINDKGKSSLSVRVRLIDGATGDVLTDAEIQGRATGQGYGEGRYVRIADEIVRLIETVNDEKS